MNKKGAIQNHFNKKGDYQSWAAEKESVNPLQPGSNFPKKQKQ